MFAVSVDNVSPGYNLNYFNEYCVYIIGSSINYMNNNRGFGPL